MHSVAIVRCGTYALTEVKDAMLESFAGFGGVGNFIRPGERVLLKPNLIASTSGDAATTHARVVEAAVEILKEHQATPVVGDSPAFGSAKGVARSTGILDVLERHRIDIIEFEKNTVFSGDVRISKSVKNFDKIINLPKLKAHNQVRFTGATKNLFGFTQGKIKAWQHLRARNDLERFCLMILKIYNLVRPAFTLVDAIDVMEREGPRGGPVRHVGLIFSGTDCLSIDTVMARCLNLDIPQVPLLQTANRHGYPGTSLDRIAIKGESIESATLPDFVYPQALSNISFTLRGVIRSILRHLWMLAVQERR